MKIRLLRNNPPSCVGSLSESWQSCRTPMTSARKSMNEFSLSHKLLSQRTKFPLKSDFCDNSNTFSFGCVKQPAIRRDKSLIHKLDNGGVLSEIRGKRDSISFRNCQLLLIGREPNGMEFKTISFGNSEEAASTRKTFFSVDDDPNTHRKSVFSRPKTTQNLENFMNEICKSHLYKPSVYLYSSLRYLLLKYTKRYKRFFSLSRFVFLQHELNEFSSGIPSQDLFNRLPISC